VSRAAKFCLFFGGILALAALAWMLFLPKVVEHELSSVTGFDFRVEVLTANPLTGRVVVRGLAVRNPPACPMPDFVQLRLLRADVEVFSSMFSGRIVIDDLDLDIGKISLVKLRDGTTNAGAFMAAFKRRGPGSGAPAPSSGPPAPAKPIRYLVKKLHLRIDQLIVADYSGSSVDEKAYGLDIDQTYIDVTGPRQLLVPGVVNSLHAFGLRHDVARLLPGDFGNALAAAVGGAAHLGTEVKDAGKKTGDYLKGLLDKLEQTPKP
jgi:hypothetical protein